MARARKRPGFDPDQARCVLPSSRLQLMIPYGSNQAPLPWRGNLRRFSTEESAGVRKGAPVALHAYTFA